MMPSSFHPRQARKHFARLCGNASGVALIEFAYSLPILIGLSLTGAELTNYVTVRMRISQVALHIADHTARLGTGTQLQAKTIDENDINDVLAGAGLQASDLHLYDKGRVIVSSLEPVATPNPTNKFKIAWQRCRGSQAHASGFGVTGNTNLDGIGPAGRQVSAPEGGATMFVEVYYEYQPLITGDVFPFGPITEIATMTVRDRRDTSQVYNSQNASIAAC